MWGIVRPADSSIRSSRSTKRQASCRAKSVPMVVLPEPMKPARHRIGTRGCGPRKNGVVVTRSWREKPVPFQLKETNCWNCQFAENDLRGAYSQKVVTALVALQNA